MDLTVMGRAGSRLPKSSKMLITTEMSTIAQETSPEIQRGIFWCYKKFPKLIFWCEFMRHLIKKIIFPNSFHDAIFLIPNLLEFP